MALVLGVPPESKGGDYTPPPKGIYNCVVKSFEEVKNPYHEQNLAEGKVSDPTQLLWKFMVIDGEHKGYEYWYYTGVRVGRSAKNKFVKVLKIVYPNFSLKAGEENVPNSEEELKAGVLLQPIRVVGDVTEPKQKKQEDGTFKEVTYGRVSDLWEPETNMNRSDVEAAVAALGATVVAEKDADSDIPF